MITISQYCHLLEKIRGKTIAIVYVFEGDNTQGFQHYDPWKSDVIADWLKAVQELKCLPFILDVRTFAQKALDGTLPYIDYVINLNAGTRNLSVLGLIPSICAFLNIPCIPANTETTIIGESKKLSNLVAMATNTILPKVLSPTDPNGIFRPLNLGSSRGVQKGFPPNNIYTEYLYQEFIPGFDMTIPILYNPLSESLEILPPVMYYPDNLDTDWFLGEKAKDSHQGYIKKAININDAAKNHFLELAKKMGINTYCRIDTRVYCKSIEELEKSLKETISLQRINFIEINPLPTIKNNINFHTSFKSVDSNSLLGKCIDSYNNYCCSPSFVGFILSSSIISLLKAMR